MDIRNVKNMTDLIFYFSENLDWNIDVDDFDDIDDIAYDFEAEDIGLKEEAFAKISSLRQLPPLVDGQKWGIFCVEFESNKFEVSALRKILSGLIPKRRNSAEHAVWSQQDLLFLCIWGIDNNRTIGIAHFEDRESGLPQIKMISCAPAQEDFTQINVFENKLSQLKWPENTSNIEKWREIWSSAFTSGYRQTIQDSSTLTKRLATEAQNIRNRILDILKVESKNGYVHLLYEKFKDTLIHDMKEQDFADMYAQTVVYGLFSARCMDTTQDDFSAEEAVACIPNTNPFLRNLMRECLGSQNNSKLSFDELEVGNVIDLLVNTRTDAIIQDFNRQTGGGKEDPVIHFYEEFLTAYDKEQKIQRGVFYTPQPVVNFIVKSVDNILKDEFDLIDGLASNTVKSLKILRDSKKRIDGAYRKVEDYIDVPEVQILDPSTGTGTFLRQVILQIYSNFCEKNKCSKSELDTKWSEFVDKNLLPRLNGFELMMAPYAVAHMKLAMVLKDTGYKFDGSSRLNIYLTNSLEEPGKSDMQMTLWEDPLTTESIEANVIKKNAGINVVLGNPPYSGESVNNSLWIQKLLEVYKKEPGGLEKLNERNSKWINDDYVKFIRLAQNFIDKAGSGMVAYINPHGFSDNPTFRGMRWNLMQSFSKIYILDLHGNSKKKETAPDGSKDENVFDIQQGVCIFIAIKKAKENMRDCIVYHADVYGDREYKYNYLLKTEWSSVEWEEVKCVEPLYLFKPIQDDNREIYENGFAINELFIQNSIGVVSARDDVVIDFTKDELKQKIEFFCSPMISDDEVREHFWPGKKAGKYLPGDTRSWSLTKAREEISNNEHENFIESFLYRPFDRRYIYYTKSMVDWSREQVMRNFIGHDNLALIAPRQTKDRIDCYITNCVCGHKTCSAYDVNTIFPLFVFEELFGKIKKSANFDESIVNKFAEKLRLKYVQENAKNGEFSAKDFFYYIFAVMHSEVYKKEYEAFLKIDFPRIPYIENKEMFFALSRYGKEMADNQLLCFEKNSDYYKGSKPSSVIEFVKNVNGFVRINKGGDEFRIDEVTWSSYVGGYQPLQKWLQDRKGRTLSIEDIDHYNKMISAIMNRENITQQIDRIMEEFLCRK